MNAPEMKKEYHFWDWKNHDHLGCRDYLLVVDNNLYYEGTVQHPKSENVKQTLRSDGPQPVQERLTADSKKRLRSPFARVIPFIIVQAAE